MSENTDESASPTSTRGGWSALSPTTCLVIRCAAAALIAIVAGVYWLVVIHGRVTLDGAELQSQLSTWLQEHGEPSSVDVTCPGKPQGKAGYVFICSVDGSSDVSGMRVTIDNDHGDVEWTPVPK